MPNQFDSFEDDVADDWYEAIIRQVQTTPPRCLSGFNAAPAHGSDWTEEVRWTLICRCGNATGAVLGYQLLNIASDCDDPNVFVGPLGFQCANCNAVTEIIDTAVHGYDGEIDAMHGRINTITYRGSGERMRVPCPKCAATRCAVTARCSHPHFDLFEDEPELTPRAQDFFDVFNCRAACAECGEEWSVADFELA